MKPTRDTDIIKAISDRIQARRRYLNLRQSDVAERMKRPIGSYVRWDSGQNAITCADLIHLADALECRAAYLLGDETLEEMQDQDMLAEYSRLTPERRKIVREMITQLSRENSSARK